MIQCDRANFLSPKDPRIPSCNLRTRSTGEPVGRNVSFLLNYISLTVFPHFKRTNQKVENARLLISTIFNNNTTVLCSCTVHYGHATIIIVYYIKKRQVTQQQNNNDETIQYSFPHNHLLSLLGCGWLGRARRRRKTTGRFRWPTQNFGNIYRGILLFLCTR